MPTPNEDQISEFVGSLEGFISAETDAQWRAIQAMWNRPLHDRVARGEAVAGLRVIELQRLPGGDETLIVLGCAENRSRYREDDFVRLSHDAPSEPAAVLARGRIALAEDTRIEVIARAPKVSEGQSDLVLDIDGLNLSEFYQQSLARVIATSRGREQIIPLLLNHLEPRGASAEQLQELPQLVRAGLNMDQARALLHAASTDLCHLIQGPPGTGKTQVLSALVHRLIQQKPNAAIFITSFTHRAIDNALARLIRDQAVPVDRICKVAVTARTPGIPHAYNRAGVKALNDGGPVVIGGTPFALRRRLADVEFDWVIVDEASQMTLPLAIMAMNAGRRWIFFGDHKQLPPVVQSIPIARAIDVSVFGRLQAGGYCTTLNLTYRLPPALAAWPSRKFYADRLVSTGNACDRQLKLPNPPPGYEEILSASPRPVFISLEHCEATSHCPEEVDAVVKLIGALASMNFPLEQVAVVVPFRNQARAIKREVIRLLGVARGRDLISDTVERMQGQERDVVIFSLTASSADYVEILASFLCQPERFNVSITRARKKMLVIGSERWLEAIPRRVPEARLIAEYLQSCVQIPAP